MNYIFTRRFKTLQLQLDGRRIGQRAQDLSMAA